MTDPGLTPRQQALIEELFADRCGDFSEHRARCQAIRQAVLTAMGQALQSTLNEHLARSPQQTLEERRELASELNQCLKSLSLAIRCPRTGRPSILVVDTLTGDRADISRFRIQNVDEKGKLQRTVTAVDLPGPFELMPAPERAEGFRRGYSSRGATRSR